MSPEAFKYVLNREDYTKITVDNMEDAQHMLHTCFGKDTQLRKDLLIDEESGTRVTSTKAKKKVVAKKKVAKSKKKVAKKKKVTKKKVAKKKAGRK